MRSQAQQKADKVRSKKLRRLPLDFNREDPADQARLDHIEKQANMTAYLKDLIDRDMQHEKHMSGYDEECEKRGIAG